MSNQVCLTARQQKFYEYVVKFYKENGFFPNSSHAAKALGIATWNGNALYGVLLQKGCFTNGQAIVNGYNRTHNTTQVQPLNIADVRIANNTRANLQKQPKQKKASLNRRQIADLLVKLLSGDVKGNSKEIAALLTG